MYGHCQSLLSTIRSCRKKFKGKQDQLYFLHDSARPHSATSTSEKLLELGWVTIPHPAYSPDLVPTDYRSLFNHLREKKFDDESNLKTDLKDFFSQKSLDFYERGIFSLAERWRQVVHSGGTYVTEN